ncbi:type VII secretion-associated serine protease mycosin [Streptomyces sp. ID01-9D]|uniref:type VII secretion-associated serine protease mycosin n=1 Tax=Streptomyces sp. ID01-9D TaxID=3028659 RepID=UPI0039F6584D
MLAIVSRTAAGAAALGLLMAVASPASAGSVRSDQWHLDVMKADQMWATSTGDGVVVAVIDSGVDADHPDLRGQVLKGLDLAPGSPGDERADHRSHGTSMAGIIAGTGRFRGGDGAVGLAPGAKILPIRLRDDDGKVNGATGSKNFNEDAPKGIRFAVDNGAKVVNISQGALSGSSELSSAVRYAVDNGALVFASVGNSAEAGNAVEYPSGTPGVIGVGSVGRDLKRADSSQYGPQVDLAAPGVDIIHACTGETRLCKSSGTSNATAIASASAALIWSKHPDWTNNQVLRVMLNTAGGPVSGKKRSDGIGYGIVRPRIALKTPGDPGPADVYPLPDLAAAASEAPSPQPSKAGDGTDQSEAPAAAAADGGGNNALWIGLGVAAAALVGGGVTAAVLRSRRRKAVAAQAPPAYQPPYGYGQPQFQPPYPPTSPPPGAPENTSH